MKKPALWMVACSCVSILGGAGTADAKVIDKNRFKGTAAVVSCSQAEEIVCPDGFSGSIQTDIFLSGEEFVARSEAFPEEPQNHLFATVRTFNSCTQEFSAAFGNVPNSSTQSLQSASLQGVVPLRDFDTEEPAGSIAVNVALQGFGDIQKDKETIKFDFEGPEGTTIVVMIHVKGDTRRATASGTLSQNGTPVACTFSEGTLIKTNVGDKTLEHP
jgi:hypothetical protein